MTGSSKIGSIEDARVTVRTGTLLDAQTSHRTHINTQTRTRGDVATGHVQTDTSVSSSSSEQIRLFIQEDGGREFEAIATNAGFGFRPGQRVSVFYVGAQRNDNPDPVGLINHSTGSWRVFESDVKRQVVEPITVVDVLRLVLGLILIVVGPVLVWNIWSGVADGMRADWQEANLGELFFKAMTALVVGVFGGMFATSLLLAVGVNLGLLPRPKPSITSQIMDQVQQAKAEAVEAEGRRATSVSS
ncbi:hypothetical protein [Brevundimonas sp.]|uniref:hypothetical protein n=1 Tax=Brevundimonas sp. TaxID=1871086 RepID=UPI003F72C2A9